MDRLPWCLEKKKLFAFNFKHQCAWLSIILATLSSKFRWNSFFLGCHRITCLMNSSSFSTNDSKAFATSALNLTKNKTKKTWRIFYFPDTLFIQTFGSAGLPLTLLLCDNNLVSKLGVGLIVPPEFVSILPVLWAETRYILNVETTLLYHNN